jgi:hypothetical protein
VVKFVIGLARVHLTEVELVGVQVVQKIHLEVAAVPLAAQDVAQLSHHLPGGVRLCGRQHLAPDVITAPGALAGSQLRVTDETRHCGADHGAVAGHDALEAHLDIADALHDFDFRLDQIAGAVIPVALAAHEERPTAGVAIRGLDHEVVSQPGAVRERGQLLVGAGPPDHVRHARHARLIRQARHHDLGTQAMAKFRRWGHDIEARLVREGLGVLVKHHKAGPAAGPSSRNEFEGLGIAQEVVAHITHAVEINAVPPPGHEHARMCAFKRVKVVQVEEVSNPAVDAEQIERGR